MTHIVSTCGTSIYDATCWDEWFTNDVLIEGAEDWGSKMAFERARYISKFNQTVFGSNTSADIRGNLDTYTKQIESLKTNAWNRDSFNRLPAELASLYAVTDFLNQGNESDLENQRFSFIYSDQEENRGIFEVLKQALNKIGAPEENIKGVPVRALNAFTEGQDVEFEELCKGVIDGIRINNEEKVVFNLTGGHKSFLMGFQQYLVLNNHTLPRAGFEIINYFEGNDTVVRIYSSQSEGDCPSVNRVSAPA